MDPVPNSWWVNCRIHSGTTALYAEDVNVKFSILFIGHFSGPIRVAVLVCLSEYLLELKWLTFDIVLDLDNKRASSHSVYLI